MAQASQTKGPGTALPRDKIIWHWCTGNHPNCPLSGTTSKSLCLHAAARRERELREDGWREYEREVKDDGRLHFGVFTPCLEDREWGKCIPFVGQSLESLAVWERRKKTLFNLHYSTGKMKSSVYKVISKKVKENQSLLCIDNGIFSSCLLSRKHPQS